MNNKKELATNLQESRVAPTHTEGEAVNTPFKRDMYESPWGAERAFFFLHLLNETASYFNLGHFEDANIRRPIPHFHTFYSFFSWIQDTNPKTVKSLLKKVIWNITEGVIEHPDGSSELLRDYYKEFGKYLANGTRLLTDME